MEDQNNDKRSNPKESVSNQQSININNSNNVTLGNISLTTQGTGKEDETTREENDSIKRMISEGNVKEAIESLLISSRGNSKIYDQLILLLGQLTRVETESRIGLIEKEDERIQTSRIAKAVLDLNHQT